MRTTILIAALLFPLSARAEMLLVEIQHSAHQFDASSSASFNFITSGAAPAGSWYQQHTPADVGSTFEAIPSVVNDIEANFASPNGRVEIDGLDQVGGSVDLIWTGSLPVMIGQGGPATVTTSVPRLGFGLTGYTLTRVTETLDSYTIDKSGRYYIADASHTYRLYGDVAVPEPSALLLAICALAWLSAYPRK